MRKTKHTYDVALSFAGADRRIAKRLAEELRQRQISVFYDEFEQANLWGKNLYDHLDRVYGKESKFCVILVSSHYVSGLWTNHERKAAQARAIQNNKEYILPLRIDDTEVPGLSSTTAFVNIRDIGPKRVAAMIAEKLGRPAIRIARRVPVVEMEVVDGLKLSKEYRAVLRPGELMRDRSRRLRRLPRFFYRVPDWKYALENAVTPHFEIWQFLNVDVREHELLRSEWPRYLPCAVADLALHLEMLRNAFRAPLHIAANGGYRSPAHQVSTHASVHCWGTAANIYRIGDDWLDDQKTIEHYGRSAKRLLPRLYVRPFGHSVSETDEHLHLDLGYCLVVPNDAPGERAHG